MCPGAGRRGRWGEEGGSKCFWAKTQPARGGLLSTSVISQLFPGRRLGKPNVQVLEGKRASHRAASSWWGCVAQRENIWKINEQNLLKIVLGPSCLLLTVNYRKKAGMRKKHTSLGELECGAFWHKLSRRIFQKKQHEWEDYYERPECQICAGS